MHHIPKSSEEHITFQNFPFFPVMEEFHPNVVYTSSNPCYPVPVFNYAIASPFPHTTGKPPLYTYGLQNWSTATNYEGPEWATGTGCEEDLNPAQYYEDPVPVEGVPNHYFVPGVLPVHERTTNYQPVPLDLRFIKPNSDLGDHGEEKQCLSRRNKKVLDIVNPKTGQPILSPDSSVKDKSLQNHRDAADTEENQVEANDSDEWENEKEQANERPHKRILNITDPVTGESVVPTPYDDEMVPISALHLADTENISAEPDIECVPTVSLEDSESNPQELLQAILLELKTLNANKQEEMRAVATLQTEISSLKSTLANLSTSVSNLRNETALLSGVVGSGMTNNGKHSVLNPALLTRRRHFKNSQATSPNVARSDDIRALLWMFQNPPPAGANSTEVKNRVDEEAEKENLSEQNEELPG